MRGFVDAATMRHRHTEAAAGRMSDPVLTPLAVEPELIRSTEDHRVHLAHPAQRLVKITAKERS